MKRSSAPAASQPFLFNQTFPTDIQFSCAMNSSTFRMNNSPQQHQHLAPSAIIPPFEGPFQVIEPGSELYIEMGPDFDYCVDPFGGIGIMEQQELFISGNGIPQDVLDDVFRLDDEAEAAGGAIPKQYPVADGLSMKQYENQLVAEMEELFPEVKSTVQRSRLMEELVKKSPPENPCYMKVHLKGEGATKKGRKMPTAPRDARRGFRCVEMVDDSGTAFKAKFYDHMPKQQFTPIPPHDISIQHRRVAELLQSPTLKNVSPEMASKIEILASGKRDVTLAKVRPSDTKSSTTTIVIKTPKRTIASSGTTVDPPADFPLPMAMIKQEPSFDATPIEVPIIMPTPVNNKQPRKQKLHSLSQCDVVFNEVTNAATTVAGPSDSRGPPARKPVPRSRGLPPNDFVTVTITDATSSAKKEQFQPARPSTPRASTTNWTAISIPSPNQAPLPPSQAYPFRKRSLVTHYRIQMTPNHNRVSGQSVESIEILDTTDEETETSGPSTVIAAPEPAAKEVPKLPGNTESIQCPFCCKVFFSSHALMLHGQNCADAVLFGNPATNEQQSSSKTATKSVLKSSTEKSKPTDPNRPKQEPDQQPTSGSTKNVTQRRTIRRLSIEILPTAFSIDNLLLCDVCKKTFRSQVHLAVHQNIHKTPTVCQFCKKKFYEPPPKHNCQEMKRSQRK
ncbi:uncharacterized protein LOC135704746 isoform X2 [Ochlerotatus camptorhynchus]|uniref:uncharacterized protein LOC135704746 isoform X2 n=1 Tax=Ochlerotatus camptorhynchus TaxID=644619 RepID=UPI0031D74A1E